MIEISTIIPVLNDAAALRKCLVALRGCADFQLNEVLVADASEPPSGNEIARIAADFGAVHIACPRGRAVQMNRAAAQARGKWLWFLHADCVPHAESLSAILELPERDAWGCFRHRLDSERCAFRLIETMDNLRARLGCPYGDQGVFVRAKVFRAFGGYAEVPLLEDVLLARSLNECSAPRVLKPALCSDARRWLQRGVAATTFRNWRIMAEFLSGRKTPEQLAKLY